VADPAGKFNWNRSSVWKLGTLLQAKAKSASWHVLYFKIIPITKIFLSQTWRPLYRPPSHTSWGATSQRLRPGVIPPIYCRPSYYWKDYDCKALRNSGHAVPQQDDATVLWKNVLRVGACTGDVMIYGACAGDVSSDRATVGDRSLLGGRQRTNEMPGLWRVRDATIERCRKRCFRRIRSERSGTI
jgi:hypothetical protein